MKVLVCAATSVEARACRAGIARAGCADQVEVLPTGIGRAAAEAALRARLSGSRPSTTGTPDSSSAKEAKAPWRPELIVSSGFIGARAATLEVGGWVLASAVAARGSEAILTSGRLLTVLERSPLRWSVATCVTVDRILGGSEEAPDGAETVDMESHALALVSAEAEIPFDLFRLVSDTPAEPIPGWIGTFAAASQQSGNERVRKWMSGSFGLLREPLDSARFIARTSRLPGRLSEGWSQLAPLLAG
jgi:hypothetical protein